MLSSECLGTLVGQRFIIFVAISLMQGLASAGTTGKISGKVVERESGAPLIGANILVVGTSLGAATDENGEYFILQVPPGVYKVRASFLGYGSVVQDKVQVSTDLTVRVDFALSSEAISIGEEVTIVAERPMVQKDVTSSTRAVASREIRSIPNVRSFQDVIRIQPGVVGLNFRGGRVRETMYMIDGSPIANPATGGYSGLSIPTEAIAEITMISGGFNAEYGNAQSGVINIVTKEGHSTFTGSAVWKSDNLLGIGRQNSDYSSFSLSGPEPITSSILPLLDVQVPGKIEFFVSANMDLTDTYVPNDKFRSAFSLFGVEVPGRQENRASSDARLTYRITPLNKLSLGYRYSKNRIDPYDHFWKLLPDRVITQKNEDTQALISWEQTLSQTTFYTLRLSQLSHRHHAGAQKLDSDGRAYDMNPPEYPKNLEPVGDLNRDGFAEAGYPGFWGEDGMNSWTLKFDVTSQVHPRHLVKSGIEWTYYHLFETSITAPGWYFPGRDTIQGLWPEYGTTRASYDVFPHTGAVYAQDKMEFDGLVINVGLRYDFWIPGQQVEHDSYIEYWESITGLKAKTQNVKGHFSPRLGISYPISDRTAMYFSYGRFTQFPSLFHVYRNPYLVGIGIAGFAGNPYYLDSEITSAYEIGFNHQIAEDMAVELKGFFKDVSGLVGLNLAGHFGLPVLLYANKDYGTTRGIEAQLKKRYSGYTMGTLSYTLSWANGRSSNPNQEVTLASAIPQPLRLRDYRLDWDQRHTINLDLHIRADKDQHLEAFGISLPDLWEIDILWRYGSGLPYTPPTRGDLIQPPINEKTGPWSSTMDTRFEKEFGLWEVDLVLFLEILNIFDRRNANQAFLNPATGRPFRFGDTTVRTIDQPDFRIYSWQEIQALLNPMRVGPGRQVYLGLQVNW